MNINYFDTPQYKLYCVKKDYNHIGKAILFQLILSNIISVILVVPIAVFSIPNILSNPTEMIEATSKNMPIIMMFSMLVGNIVPYFICANCLNLDIPSLFKWKNKSVKVCLYASGLLLFSNIALSFVYNYLSEVLTKIGLNTQTPPLDYGDGVFNIVIMAVITCIIAPITEEVIFRGVMLNVFKKQGELFAVVITSIIFSLMHGNIIQSFATFFMGLILGYVAIKSNSIVPCIIAHFVNNMVAFVLSYEEKMGELASTIIMAVIIVICIVVGILFIKNIRKFSPLQKYDKQNNIRGVTVFSCSWSLVLSTAIFLFTIIFSMFSNVITSAIIK